MKIPLAPVSLSLCLLLTGLSAASANEAAAKKKTALEKLGGPYPSFDVYCAKLDHKMQKTLKEEKEPPEDVGRPPYCSKALLIADTVGSKTEPPVLPSPQPPFLAAHVYEYLERRKYGYQDFYARASGLAIQTEAGWFVFNLWRTSNPTPGGCAGDGYKVDSILTSGAGATAKLIVAYRVETDGPSDNGGAYSRTRFQVDCALNPQGQPACIRRWLNHKRWTGEYR